MSSRRQRPATERRRVHPRHPTGRARRRWPRAFDGGHQPLPNARYRRAFEAEGEQFGTRKRLRFGMQRLRESPARNGLIGLAIAGTAAPIAINRYQQVLRTDPAHERLTTRLSAGAAIDEQQVMERWRTMLTEAAAAAESENAAVSGRDQAVERNLERYSEYGVSRAMAEDIYDAAIEAGVDPDVAFGLVKAESSFSNRATSHVGAIGLTQLMPRTAAWMEPGTTTRDLRDPKTNLRVGMKYLSYLVDKYKGDENLALLAYNRGPGTVDRVLSQGGNPGNGYVEMVRERTR